MAMMIDPSTRAGQRLMKKLNIPQTGKTKASSKYRNNKTEVDGIWFDSKKEADRYCVLLSRQRRKEITDLKLQVRFKLEVNGVKICSYIADFTYMDNGELIVEDVKSTHTAQCIGMF